MRTLLFIIMLLLMLPLASASETITVGNQNEGRQTFTLKNRENYTVNLVQPPFIYNISTNESVWQFLLSVQQGQPGGAGELSNTKHFKTSIEVNDSTTLDFDFHYIRKGLTYWFTGYWEVETTVSMNGNLICSSHEGDIGTKGFTNLVFKQYYPRLYPFPSVTLTFGGVHKESIETRVPYLYWELQDNVLDTTEINCNNPATGNRSIPYEGVSAPIITTFTPQDDQLYSHSFQWRFETRERVTSRALNSTEDVASCDLRLEFSFVDICISDIIVTLLDWTVGFIVNVLQALLNLIPGGNMLGDFTRQIFGSILDAIAFMIELLKAEGVPFGIVGLWWMHLIYFQSFGFALWAITGKEDYAWYAGYWFAKVTILGSLIMGYYLFIAFPMWAWERVQSFIESNNPVP